MKLLLCIHCTHFKATGDCWEPANVEPDMVRGGFRAKHSPYYLRTDSSKCGQSAEWFEEKLNLTNGVKKETVEI